MPRCLLILLCVSACSHAEKTERQGPRPVAAASAPDAGGLPRAMPPDPRYFTAPNAPDPLACREDKDCISDTIVDPARGCCVQAGDPMPQTWAWHAWVTEHRMASDCHDAKCEPVPVPDKLPRACFLEARCVALRCQATCPPGDAGMK